MGRDVSGPGLPPPLAPIPAQIASLADYEPYARERMSAATWAWLASGAGDGLTALDNIAAFQRLRLQNRVLADLAGGDTTVELFGHSWPHPIFLAPLAYQRLLHPEGERATALAASALAAGMIVSTQASLLLEDIAAIAQAPLWFQLYLQADRDFSQELVRRAERCGYRALVVTVDAPVAGMRNAEQRAGFVLPPGIEAVNLRGMPPATPFTARAGETTLFDSPQIAAAARWPDLEWLRRQTSLPVLLKGVLRADDAARAVAAGVDGLIVSNHGGRVLDGLPATIDALPAVAAAVRGRIPLLLDGGIRRGTDVLKALALGARAVLVGRPFACALACAGAPGVAHVVHLLRTELEMAMALTGCRNLAAIDPSVLWPPR